MRERIALGAPAGLPPLEPDPLGPALPAVRFMPQAPYPQAALADGRESTVLLDLVLDDQGRVVEASVAEGGGEDFDQAVLSVAPRMRFSPARDQTGQVQPARIQYLYRFELSALPVLTMEGRVRAGGTRRALANASVVVESLAPLEDSGEPVRVTALSDADGAFQLFDLDPGPWRLLVAAPGFGVEETELTVVAGQVVEAELWLSPDRPWEAGTEAGEVMEIIGYRLAPEIAERRLDAGEVRYMPGTGGDIVRAVQTQPGVARSPFNTGSLVVRGTSADSSGFFLGGQPVPIVYHFGGLSTVINSDSLSEVRFLPGSYGVRYGRKLGGVVDLVTDDQIPESSHGYARIDLMQAALFHEQRLGEQWSLTASARRSYIDAVLAPVVNLDPTYSVRLPAFTDGQLRLLHRRKDGSVMEAMLLGSDDRFTYTEFGDEDGESESQVKVDFLKAWLRWEEVLAGGWRSELAFMSGPEATRAEYLSQESAYDEAQRDSFRAELTRPVPEGGVIGWRFGVDLQSVDQEYSYQVEELDGFFPYASDEAGSGTMIMPAFYLEQTQKAGPIEGIPGVRVDGLISDFGYRALAVDPRFRLRAEIGPSTVIHAGIGRYSQFPLLRELLLDEPGSAGLDLVPEWALQATVGVEQQLLPELKLEATLYHSWLQDLVVGHDDRFTFELSPPPMAPYDTDPYDNEGTGRSLGLESLLRYETDRSFAFVALTVSRSTRVEREGQEPTLFEFDQPVLLTVVGTHQLPRGWRVGGRFRYTSGNPYTPVANRVYDLDDYLWYPVFEEGRTARMSSWWAVDLRGDKEWSFKGWALSVYLDLQNATNRKNIELLNFTPDYSAEIAVYGLPILPAFGVEASW